MLSFGLNHNEVYITLLKDFMTVVRVASGGGMSSLLTYLSTQVPVAFREAVQYTHRRKPVLLSQSDIEYLLGNDLEEVVWHAVETTKQFPLGQRGRTQSLERLLESDRMTPSLFLYAMGSISQGWRADLSPALGKIVNHPNAKSALLPLFIVATRGEEAALEMMWRLPPDSGEVMTAMLCGVITCPPFIVELLSQGANPSDTLRTAEV